MKKIHILLLLVAILTLVAGTASAKMELWVESEPEHPGETGKRMKVEIYNKLTLKYKPLYNDPDGYKTEFIVDFSHLVTDKSCRLILDAHRSGKNLAKCELLTYDKTEISRQITMKNVKIEKLKEVFDPDDGTGIQYVTLVAKSKKKSIGVEDVPQTGDNAPLLLWAILAATSCAAFFLLRKSASGRAG